jgi:hypothetical protein
MSYNSFSNNNTGPNQYALLQFRKTNSFTTVLTGDTLARIEFSGYNATADFLLGASIGCRVTGVPNLNIPSELLFYTSTGLATVIAMVIGQNGNVEITPLSGVGLTVSGGEIISTGNLNFAATAQRITGDMSNATHVNRLCFQTNVVNGATSPFIIPNGSGTIGQIVVANASDPTNSAFGSLQVDATSVKLVSNVLGIGVQLPMEIRIGATAAIDINTSRAVSIANTSAGVPLTITGTTSGGLTVNQSNSAAANISLIQSSATAEPPYVNFFKSRSGGNINAADGLGNIRFFGFATANQVAAQITCIAESIGAARVSGGLNFWTTNTAGSTGQRLVLVADGGLSINTPSTAISALTVNGFATAGTYAQQNNAYVTSGLFSAFRALNVDGTAGGSCQIEVSVFNQLAGTGGDATLLFGNYGGTNIKIGNDVSVNQFSMSTGTLGDANTFLTFDVATTQINKPRQCSFMARKSATSLNVTGANTVTIVFDAESFDVSNSYNNATGIFTAPKTGKYFFYATVRIEALTALMTAAQISIAATGQSIFSNLTNLAISRTITPNDVNTMQVSGIISMTTADTAQVQVTVLNGAGNTASIYGGAATVNSTFFSGQLLS